MPRQDVTVTDYVARAVVAAGADTAFGVVGSGNFHVTNALVTHGARFVATRHEGGAATMADAYARVSRRLGVVTVHQGCGLTNAMTGITEAAKSRTPLVVLAAATGAGAERSNFFVDQSALARAVGAVGERVHSAETAAADVERALTRAVTGRRTVVLDLPLDVQPLPMPVGTPDPSSPPAVEPVPPSADDVVRLVDALSRARRPVFVAGRGARISSGRTPLEQLAERCGALLATSAVAKGFFHGNPWSLDVSGGFASPLAAELITGADLLVGWGCALNMWTTRHGRLVGPQTTVVQVDDDADALGAHRSLDIGVHGDVALTAQVVAESLGDSLPADGQTTGYRDDALRQRIQREVSWRDVPRDDLSTDDLIDPRTLSRALDDMLPAERIIGVDSGNFMGYPSMYLQVPDDDGFCFTQAFQSVGLGLATAIGAALARPDRLPIAALGDGGALMGVSELETAVRLGLEMLVVVYDDSAYGAEVHHFGPDGHPLDTVRFPEADIASIGRGFGCDGVTVRQPADLDAVRSWLDGPRGRPLVVDAKVTRDRPSWWLEEAFQGHG